MPSQTKEYLPAHALRRILALQNELMTSNGTANRANITPLTGSAGVAAGARQPPATQRTLLSSNFAAPIQNGTRGLGRNLLSAGDRLRDLIVPDALASVVTAPAGWIPGIGSGAGKRGGVAEKDGGKRAERLRAELEEILAGTCPVCESVVAGLDKPFVKDGEGEAGWEL